jgi:hypothetical protein
MQRETKIIIVLIIMMSLSFWLNPVISRGEEIPKGFHFGLSEKMEISDSQKYLRPFDQESETLLGTGACYGPFFSAGYQSRWIADFLSVCGLGAVSQAGESTATGGIDIINFLGIQGGIQYDPKTDDMFYTIGFSVTGLGKQLLK